MFILCSSFVRSFMHPSLSSTYIHRKTILKSLDYCAKISASPFLSMALWLTANQFGIRRDVHISSFHTDQKFTVSDASMKQSIFSSPCRRRNIPLKSIWTMRIGKWRDATANLPNFTSNWSENFLRSMQKVYHRRNFWTTVRPISSIDDV